MDDEYINKISKGMKQAFYKDIKSRIQVLVAKGVKVNFHTFEPNSYGENCVLGMPNYGTERAPRFPQELNIRLWDDNDDVLKRISDVEEKMVIWEEYTQTNFFKLKEHFGKPINQL